MPNSDYGLQYSMGSLLRQVIVAGMPLPATTMPRMSGGKDHDHDLDLDVHDPDQAYEA